MTRPPASQPIPDLAFFFFFNDTATTEIYTLSLHDALPISAPRWPSGSASPRRRGSPPSSASPCPRTRARPPRGSPTRSLPDRKSTRLNSSHLVISYAVFCLKKKSTSSPDPRRAQGLQPQPP